MQFYFKMYGCDKAAGPVGKQINTQVFLKASMMHFFRCFTVTMSLTYVDDGPVEVDGGVESTSLFPGEVLHQHPLIQSDNSHSPANFAALTGSKHQPNTHTHTPLIKTQPFPVHCWCVQANYACVSLWSLW